MAHQTQPSGLNYDAWGPQVLSDGRFYVFQGERKPIPASWKNLSNIVDNLKFVERLEWSFALPGERQQLFNRKLEILTKELPVNWSLVVCALASGLIIFVGIASAVNHQIAKL
jgi:hypothetical protein